MQVAAVFIHPCWRTRTSTDTVSSTHLNLLGDHDVAVLRLVSPVPSHPHQRYAVLDDGSLPTSSQPGTIVTFHGHGAFNQQGEHSESIRTAAVKIADASQCENKFLLQQDVSNTNLASTAASLATTTTRSLNFIDRQLCIGGNSLDIYSLRGGCPSNSNNNKEDVNRNNNGGSDVGGPIETSNGILIGIYSRLTPPTASTEMFDVEGSDTDNLEDTHANRNPNHATNDCGGIGRGRYYDIFTKISYYRGWIQRVVEERYDGGVCSTARLLDSPLRCPRGSYGDAEGSDPLKGLLGGGGGLSSLAYSSTTSVSDEKCIFFKVLRIIYMFNCVFTVTSL